MENNNQKPRNGHYGSQQGGNRQGNQRFEQRPTTIGGKNYNEWIPSIHKWIQNGIDKQTIDFANDMGKILKDDGLTTSQIRNAFGEMRKIQMNGFEKEKHNFLLLKAKLAYATKRQQAKGMDNFYQLFCNSYDAVDTSSSNASAQFERLLQIMEAVLAFHKFYGGQ